MPKKPTEIEKQAFWKSLLLGVEVQPIDQTIYKGASGLDHKALAAGLDEDRKRLVLVLPEPDGRTALLARQDIQATLPDYRVIAARPGAVNLATAAKLVTEYAGSLKITPELLDKLPNDEADVKKKIDPIIERFTKNSISTTIVTWSAATLPLVSMWKEIIHQLSYLEFTKRVEEKSGSFPDVSLNRLVAVDPVALDRRLGICSVPLYDFTNDDAEVLRSGTDAESITSILRKLDIHQYFFPPPDQLSLGLIDNAAATIETVTKGLSTSEKIGHPLGQSELIQTSKKAEDIIDKLQQKGLVAEGEIGLTTTENGAEVRAMVKFRPKEGIISQISRLISIKADFSFKDFFN